MSPGLSNLFGKAKSLIDTAAISCPLGLNNFSVYKVQLRKLTFENTQTKYDLTDTRQHIFGLCHNFKVTFNVTTYSICKYYAQLHLQWTIQHKVGNIPTLYNFLF